MIASVPRIIADAITASSGSHHNDDYDDYIALTHPVSIAQCAYYQNVHLF